MEVGGTLNNRKGKVEQSNTLCYPRGKKRKKGRQIKRWEDEIMKTAGRLWMRLAGERCVWKRLEEAFAKGHTDRTEVVQ